MKENQGNKIGFVYILTNPAMPNLIKIGCSQKNPHIRKTELNSTGVPAPFEVAYFVIVPDFLAAEKLIHERLRDYRFSNNREFFKISVSAAIEKIKNIISENIIHEHLNFHETNKIDQNLPHPDKKELIDVFEGSLEKLFGQSGVMNSTNIILGTSNSICQIAFFHFRMAHLNSVNQKIINSLRIKAQRFIDAALIEKQNNAQKYIKEFGQEKASSVIKDMWNVKKHEFSGSIRVYCYYNLLKEFFDFYYKAISLGEEVIMANGRKGIIDTYLNHELPKYFEFQFSHKNSINEVIRYPCTSEFKLNNFEDTDWIYIGYREMKSGISPFYVNYSSYEGNDDMLSHFFGGYIIHPSGNSANCYRLWRNNLNTPIRYSSANIYINFFGGFEKLTPHFNY